MTVDAPILELRKKNIEEEWKTPELAYNTWKERIENLVENSLLQIYNLDWKQEEIFKNYTDGDAQTWVKTFEGETQKVKVSDLKYNVSQGKPINYISPTLDGNVVYETTYSDRQKNTEIKEHFEYNSWLWEIVSSIMRPKVAADRLKEMRDLRLSKDLSIENLVEEFAKRGKAGRHATTVFDQAALFVEYADELKKPDVDYKYVNSSYDSDKDTEEVATVIKLNNERISIYNHMNEHIVDKAINDGIVADLRHPNVIKENRNYGGRINLVDRRSIR